MKFSLGKRSQANLISNLPFLYTRWLAICAQMLGVVLATSYADISLPMQSMVIVIATSLGINIVATVKHRGHPIDEGTALFYIIFDIIQYSTLLYLSGGIENPFCRLLIVPPLMAAVSLSGRSVFVTVCGGIIALSLLHRYALPLSWPVEGILLSQNERNFAFFTDICMMVLIPSVIWRASSDTLRMQKAFVLTQDLVSQRREQLALGALAAAAVHELGSPLSTIAIIAKEMHSELDDRHPLKRDADILLSQSNRCRDILADIARNPERTEDLRQPVPLNEILTELVEDSYAKAPSKQAHITQNIGDMPTFRKSPNLLYALSNIIDNAMSFARSRIDIEVTERGDDVLLFIKDDGPGFDGEILRSVGKPYISRRQDKDTPHMGLGIFISSLLIEESGGSIEFGNDPRGGASVLISWNRAALGQKLKPVQ